MKPGMDYMRDRHDLIQKIPTITMKMIVLHYKD